MSLSSHSKNIHDFCFSISSGRFHLLYIHICCFFLYESKGTQERNMTIIISHPVFCINLIVPFSSPPNYSSHSLNLFFQYFDTLLMLMSEDNIFILPLLYSISLWGSISTYPDHLSRHMIDSNFSGTYPCLLFMISFLLEFITSFCPSLVIPKCKFISVLLENAFPYKMWHILRTV